MANPQTLIRRGLDKGQAISKNPTYPAPRLAELANLRGDLPAIKTLKSAVIAAHAQVEQIRAATADAIEQHSTKIKADNKRLGMVPGEKDGHWIDNSSAANLRKAHIELLTNRMVKDVRTMNAEHLTKNMTTIREARAKLDLMRTLWSDPVRVLMRNTLDSKRRATCVENLSAAGPVEVEEAARQAVMSVPMDVELAAACCVRVDSMPKASRESMEMTKADIGEQVMREDMLRAKADLGLAGIHAEMAELAVREATGSEVRPEENIRLDLRIRDLEAELGVKLEDLEDKPGKPTIVEPTVNPVFVDNFKPEKSEAMKRVEAMSEVHRLYIAGEHVKSKELADKWGIDIFEDEESEENGTD